MKSNKRILIVVLFTLMFSCASIPAATADTPRQLWAIVIGVEGGSATHLDNDAQDFRNVLVSKYGYPSSHIRLLINGEATQAAVRDALKWVRDQEQPQDGVTIFFSCHGAENNIVLYDRCLNDYELAHPLSQFESHNILVVINSCGSGSFTDVADSFESGILITACAADEITYDIPLFGNTIFAEYFLEALSGPASVQDSFNYAYYHLAVEPPGTLPPTHPQMVDKYGEAYYLSSPVHAPWFSNLMAVVSLTVFSYTLHKKKKNISTESILTE